jgi:serine O-acetyltransferase
MSNAFIEDIHRCIGVKRELTARKAVRAVLRDYGLQALMGYRLGRFLLRSRGKLYWWPALPFGWLLYFLLSSFARISYDIRLHLNADIGPGLYIGHFGGILLDSCKLGKHCAISQSTRIHAGGGNVGPVLGDRVWVGAHAQIIGPHTIGTGSTVSAAAIVTRDVPEKALCIGNPVRVVHGYDNTAMLRLE